MNYQKFITDITHRLSEKLGPQVSLSLQQITKNNGTIHDGLVIIQPEVNISPTIYLMPYYHRHLDGVSMEDICADIVTTYQRNQPRENFDTTRFTDFEKAKKNIVMRLISYERNAKLLEQVPHMRYLDLAIVFLCLLCADENQQANILIYNHHLDFWKVGIDTLYQCACNNTPKHLPHKFINMNDIFEELVPHLPSDFSSAICPKLYILSNVYHTNGATAILYDGLLKQIADSLDRDLVILPSSIHEVLLSPIEEDVPFASMSDMVREVNATQLADDEILSDHVYLYLRENGFVTIPFESTPE